MNQNSRLSSQNFDFSGTLNRNYKFEPIEKILGLAVTMLLSDMFLIVQVLRFRLLTPKARVRFLIRE